MTYGHCQSAADGVLCPVSAAMVHWIRQIKEMLSSLDSIEMPEKAGPLDEINFWTDRCGQSDLFIPTDGASDTDSSVMIN